MQPTQDDVRPPTALGRSPAGRLAGGLLALLVLLLVASQSWQIALRGPGIDYYQYWVAGRALLAGQVDDLWAPETREELGRQGRLEASRALEARQRRAARERASLEIFSTPFLYVAIAGPSGGRYERDFRVFQLLATLAGLAAILLLAGALGWGPLETALLAAAVSFAEPYQSELTVGNVNRLQLLAIGLFVALRGAGAPAGRDVLAGAALGLLAAFKPNAAPALAALLAARVVARRWRRAGLELAGMAAGALTAVAVSAIALGSLRPWLQWPASIGELLTTFDAIPVEAGNFSLVQLAREELGVGLGPVIAPLLAVLFLIALALGTGRGREAPDTASSGVAERRRDALLLGLGSAIAIASARLAWLHYFLLPLPLFVALVATPSVRAGRGAWALPAIAATAFLAVSLHPFRLAESVDPRLAAFSVAGGNLLLLGAGLARLAMDRTGTTPRA